MQEKSKVQPQKEQEQPKPPTRVDLLEERVVNLENELIHVGLTVLELGEKLESMQGMNNLAQMLATVAGNGGKKGAAKFGGSTGPKKVKDTKTGVTYDSLSKCAKAVAAEFNLSPDDHFAWYPIYKQDPERFEILV